MPLLTGPSRQPSQAFENKEFPLLRKCPLTPCWWPVASGTVGPTSPHTSCPLLSFCLDDDILQILPGSAHIISCLWVKLIFPLCRVLSGGGPGVCKGWHWFLLSAELLAGRDSGLLLNPPVSSAKPCPSQTLSTHGKAEWMEGVSSRALS